MFKLPKDLLIIEYIKNKKSSIEIAKILNCSSKTVLNYLHKYDIPVRPKNEVFNFINRRHTKEIKNKMSEASKGKPKSLSHRDALSKAKIILTDKERKEHYNKYQREYKRKHRNKEYQNKYSKNKYKNNIHYKVRQNVSTIIRKRLKKRLSSKKGQSINKHLSFTIDELIVHLENHFRKGMNWKNYGKTWQIDHIIPDCKFNYKNMKDKDFQECWNLKNLQPLFAEENWRKSGKI